MKRSILKARGLVLVHFVALTALWLFPAAAVAERPATTKLLPEKTLAYVCVPNTGELVEKFKAASMGRMLQDEKLKPFVGQLYGSAAQAFGQIQDRVGLPLDELLAVPQGEICLAVLPVEKSTPCFFLMMDVGDRLTSAQKLLDRADEELQNAGANKETETVGDVKINVYTMPQGGVNTLVQFQRDGTIVLGTNLPVARQLLQRWDGGEGAGLSENKNFTSIYSRCKGTKDEHPQVVWYVDPIELAKAIMGNSTAGRLGLAILPALGLDGLKGVGGSIILATEEFDAINHIHVLLDTPRSGVVKAAALGSGDTTPEPFIPADVTSYMTVHFDFETAFKEVAKLFNSFRGENALQNEAQNRIGERLGVEFEKDLLGALDGRVTYATWIEKPVRFNSQTNLVAIKLKDATAAKETLTKILGKFENIYKKESYGGVTYYEFEAPQPPRPSGAEGQASLELRTQERCLAILGDYLIGADSVKCLQQAIITHSDVSKSLANELDFKLIASKINRHSAGTKPGMITFSRPEESMRMFYDLANADNTRRTLASQAENNRFFKSLNDALKDNPLPPFTVLAQYLAPTGGMLTNDETGFHYMSFGLRRK